MITPCTLDRHFFILPPIRDVLPSAEIRCLCGSAMQYEGNLRGQKVQDLVAQGNVGAALAIGGVTKFTDLVGYL